MIYNKFQLVGYWDIKKKRMVSCLKKVVRMLLSFLFKLNKFKNKGKKKTNTKTKWEKYIDGSLVIEATRTCTYDFGISFSNPEMKTLQSTKPHHLPWPKKRKLKKAILNLMRWTTCQMLCLMI